MDIERPVSRQPLPPHATRVFEGQIFDVYQWEQELYDGTTATFEKLKRDDTVVIIPVLPDRSILIEEEEQPGRTASLTLPAGRLEDGEDPLVGAKRELLEETGYESDEWTLYRAYQPVLKIDWAIYVFVARNCRKVAEQNLDPGEKISVSTVSFDELIALSREPRFTTEELRTDLIEAKHHADSRALLEKAFFG